MKNPETEYDHDWSWQGKRPDQVSKSYKIFAFCVFVLFVLGMFALEQCLDKEPKDVQHVENRR